jgi:hypothetical protein
MRNVDIIGCHSLTTLSGYARRWPIKTPMANGRIGHSLHHHLMICDTVFASTIPVPAAMSHMPTTSKINDRVIAIQNDALSPISRIGGPFHEKSGPMPKFNRFTINPLFYGATMVAVAPPPIDENDNGITYGAIQSADGPA